MSETTITINVTWEGGHVADFSAPDIIEIAKALGYRCGPTQYIPVPTKDTTQNE